jgi:hypothetical protein
MDSQLWWWFIVSLLSIYFNSIDSRHLLNSSNESTNKKQTSKKPTDNIFEHQSIFSITLAKTTTTIHSNSTIQSFITKPNSYLYNLDDDEEIFLDRVKREPPPFVCKGKISIFIIDLMNIIFS